MSPGKHHWSFRWTTPSGRSWRKKFRYSLPTVDALKVDLTRIWDEITVEQCETIVRNYQKPLRKCIDADVGIFDHLLYVFLLLFTVIASIKFRIRVITLFLKLCSIFVLLQYLKKFRERFSHPVYI